MDSAKGLIAYDDPEVIRLRTELMSIEEEVLNLEEEKSALDRQILAYNERFRRELGELMENLMNLRRLRRAREFTSGKATAAEREEAEDDVRQLHEDRQQPDQIRVLSEAEQQELKKLFRQGTKLCHPDAVAPEFKVEASLRFQELKEAQLRNDLDRMRVLIAVLEQGGFASRGSAQIDEADVLRSALQRLRHKRQNLMHEIAALRQTPTFEAIQGIEDWTAYFANFRQRLEKQIAEETRNAGA